MGDTEYCEHLFEHNTDGYINLMQLQNGKVIKVYNTSYHNLRDIVEETKGQEDVFISSNTYYLPQRAVSHIRQFRALYIDIDLVKYEKSETVYMIYDLVNTNKIPMPSLTVDSGRGIHLYWRIKDAPYGALHTWQELEDFLYKQLKPLGADIKATDGARVLRLPGTINSKNTSECKVLICNDDVEYTMYDLRDKYLYKKPKKALAKNTRQLGITKHLFNSYTLHLNRSRDIVTVCELRKYKMLGYRNFVLHCYAYWTGIYVRQSEDLTERVKALNNKFDVPLKDTEVDAILKCVPKAIDKFINYEQGVRSGEVKRVSKGMRDKAGYWYKNITLIEALNITFNEQHHLKTIIGIEEKYLRNNIRRTPRNEQGLTPRQQKTLDNETRIKELHYQSLSATDIARILGMSRRQVDRVVSKF
jgi:hypothetical protein